MSVTRCLKLTRLSPKLTEPLGFDLQGYGNDARLAEALRADPSRKGSVVNVNPVNTRPQSDTPEIRKYKKRFNSEILCAALWGKSEGAPLIISLRKCVKSRKRGGPAQINISVIFLMRQDFNELFQPILQVKESKYEQLVIMSLKR